MDNDNIDSKQVVEAKKQIEKEVEATNKNPHSDKPLFSFDFDGVICRPPLGQNRVLGRQLHDDELPESVRRVDAPAKGFQDKTWLKFRGFFETIKYLGRIPMPQAREGIVAINELRRPVIITGRSFLAKEIVEAWLKKYDMTQFFEGVYANNTNVGTRLYKLYTLRAMGITEHADDDGAISYYLARKGIQVYLRDWSRNEGLPYPSSVVHFRNIEEIAQHLAKHDQQVKQGDLSGLKK